MEEQVSDYITQSDTTNPKNFSCLYDVLPDEIPELCRIIQGLLVHRDSIYLYEVKCSADRHKDDVYLNTVENMLKEIMERNNNPMTLERPVKHRLKIICRDFAVMLCSILRHKKIPARPRTVFSKYFRAPDGHEHPFLYDHWLCEYWNDSENRWVNVDAGLNEIEKKEYSNVEFNQYDIPRELTISSGEAWIMLRNNETSPANFGDPDSQNHGLDLVRRHMLLDFACMNKSELLTWHEFGIINQDMLDKIASMLLEPTRPEDIQKLYSEILATSLSK